jgi:hypothetical protein
MGSVSRLTLRRVKEPSVAEMIDRLGGPTAVGELCEISPQAVSAWKQNGMPKSRRMFLQLLRPEAFALVDASAVAQHESGRPTGLTEALPMA